MLPQNQTQMTSTAVNPFDEELARGAVALGTTLSDEDRTSSEALSDYARSQATDAINNNAEAWLSKFGTASVQLSLEKGGKLSDSSVDWLVPLYDTPKNMLFTQLGMRHKDDRNTVNMGVGSRFFLADDWMFGLNSFIDSDITGQNYRLGLGMELWGDYLKLSVNGYRRLSGWHQSSDVEDYDERPADGFDIRANGFLPSYPQLGGTLAYEQYFGDEVALFGKDNRQRNPYAVTVGVNYTPIPMLTFSAEQRMGKGDQSELNLALDFTLQLDKSLRENLSPAAVVGMRKLSHSRYDLVERNNDIVLEYRKQQVIRLSLTPDQISGPGGGQQTVTVAVTSKHGVKNLRWQGASFTAAGGTIKPLNSTHYRLTLPAWQDAATGSLKKPKDQSDASRLLNTYVLTATAEDNKGNISDQAQVNVEVLPPVAHFMGGASVEGDYAPPDGTTPVNITWLIVNGDNKPVSGENVDFNITFNDGSKSTQKISTNTNGQAILSLTSTVTGKADVAAHLSNGEASVATVHYVDAQPDASHSSLTATPASIVANGTDKSTLTLMLQDSLSRPVTGLSNVSFALQGVSGTTLRNMTESKAGEYVATLSGTRAGVVIVTPLIDNQPLSGISTRVALISDNQSAHIAPGDMTVTTNNAIADGVSKNQVAVKVTDSHGNPVAGQAVQFSAGNIATIGSIGTTDNNGMLSMSVTSVNAGTATITATVNGQSQSVDVTFSADNDSAQIASGELMVISDGAKADNKTANQVRVKVTDSQGNALPDMRVNFSASNGATIAAYGQTTADGTLELPVISAKAGVSTITASINDSSQSVNMTFVADSDSAAIADGALQVITNNALANGVQSNKVQVKVTDANGNAADGETVSFTASNGATVATSGITNSQGIVQMPVTSKTAGSSTVTATVNGSSQSVDLTFMADDSTAEIASGALTALTDSAAANGTAVNQVQVRVTDASGNALAGQKVSFSATNGATIAASGTTAADGSVVLPVTSMTAGTSTITASINSSQQTVGVTFVADGSTAEIASGALTVTANNAVADGSASNQIQAIVTDAGGNTVASQTVSFSATNGATLAASATTDGNGRIQLPVTSTTSGTSSIKATVNGSSQTVEMTFVADGSTAQIVAGNLTVLTDNAVANGTAENQVQVDVTDKNGNPVADQTVSFSATNGATLAASATSDGNGRIQLPVTSTTAGISSIKATVNGSSQTVEMTFVADGSTADIIDGNMTVTANNAVADASDTNGVRVAVTDANGNPVKGQTVSFSATNGATVAASGVTDAAGVVTAIITSTTAGDSIIKASINGKTQQVTVNFVADSRSAHFATGSLVVLNDNAVANGVLTNQLQATVVDDNNNPVPDVSVAFQASNGATVNAQSVTDAGGKATATLSSTTAGVSTVTATVNGMESTADVTFVADHSTATIIEGNVTITADNAVANGTATNQVQVKVTDAGGNVVDGEHVSFTASNGATVTPDGTTDSNGMLTVAVTSLQAGSSTVNVTVNGTTLPVSMTFVADDSTAEITDGHFTIVTDGAVADGTANNVVNVRVTDKQGNAVSGQTVSFSATNGATVIATGTTDTHGSMTAQVTSLTAGTSTVTATVNGSSQHLDLTFVADSSSAQIAAGDLNVIADNAVANGTAGNTVQVRVTDASGNPVNAADVDFTASNGAIIAAGAQTDANGQITLPVTSVKAGSSTVSATINGSSRSVDMTFTADSSTAQIAAGNLSVVADHAVANGTDANQVQVKVTDANANAVPGVAVSFSVSNDATIKASGNTAADGTLIMTLTSLKSGTSTVTATVNGNSQDVDVTFVADDSTAEVLANNMTITANNATANATATNSVRVMVTDANANPVPEQTVSLSASNGATIASAGVTDASGIVEESITSSKAGDSVITARVNGKTQQVTVTFIADGDSAHFASDSLVILSNNAIANGSATNQIQATIVDDNNNPIPAISVTFQASNGATIDAQGTSDVNGKVTATLSSTTAGSSTVTAILNGSQNSVDVMFVADSSTATITSGNITAIVDDATANGTAANQVQVKVTDANDNAADGETVSFTASNGATVATSGITNSQGIVQMPVTSKTAGSSTVTATVNGSSQSVDLTFMADDSTAEIASGALTALTDNAAANGTAVNQVQVRVTDASGNALAGQKVSFSATNGATIAASGTTAADGSVVLPVTSMTAGTSTITASINSSQQTVGVTFVADGSTAEIASGALTVTANNAVADGSASNQIQAIVTDAGGNTVASQTVSFSATNGATLAASATTDGNGRIQLPVTSTTAGTSSIKATVNGNSQTVEMTFVADGSTADITDGNMTVTANNAVADASDTNGVRVAVTDANGNPVKGQTVSFSATNGATVAASGVTDAAGVVTAIITSTTAGDSIIKASINGKTQQVTVNFVADSRSAHFATGSLVVLNDNAVANGVLTNQLQATVVDDNNNPVPDVSVAFQASNGATVNAQSVTDAGGKATATLSSTTAGVSTVTATVNGMESTADVTFVADHSTATIIEGNVTITADNAVANGTATNQVQVKVTDAGGNVVDGEHVSFTASNGATVTPDGTTDSNGMLTVAVTSLQAGSSTVNVTVNGTTLPVSMTFVADDSTAEITDGHFTIVTDGAVADGTANNVVNVRVTDKQGNAVSGQTVSFSATNGATVIATGTTDTHGSMTAQVTSLTAGTSTVTATVNGSSQHLDLTFVADSSSAQIAAGDLNVIADNAVANGTAGNTVQVRVTDASGNPVNAADVDFTASNGAIIAAGAQTDANGQITLPVTSVKAGSSTVSATINGSSRSVDMTFTADSSTAQIAAGNLSVVADHAVANGTDANQVQVKVTDANDNALSGQTISLSASNGVTIAASALTTEDGTVLVPITSVKAVYSTITATINGSSQSVEVTFIGDDGTAQIAAGDMTVSADNAVADGSASNQVQVKVTDANGNPVPDQTVDFSASNGATVAASGTTDINGLVQMDITSLKSGISTVTATLNNSIQRADVTFTADNSTAQIAAGDLTTLVDNAIANGIAADVVQVKVTDSNGNSVADQSVSFSANNGATIAASGTSDENGLVRMDVTNLMATKSTVTARVNGSSQSTDVTFMADSSTAAIAPADIALLNDGAKADGSDADIVQVTVKDANGNVVADQDVSFSADNSATITTNGTTDANGVVKVPVTTTLAGTSTVTASINGSSQTIVATFVADNTTAQIRDGDIEVTVNGSLSDGVSQNQVMVKVTDANNNPVSGADVTFSATNGATVPSTAATDSGGVVKVPVTSKAEGISQVTASLNGSNQTVEMTFIASTIPVITDVQDKTGKVTGSLTSGQPSDEKQPTLSGAADSNATIRLFSNGIQIASGTADADGLWSITPGGALSGDGDHTLTVTGALTPTSNQSPQSEAFVLNLDTVAQLPTIDTISDSSGDIPRNGMSNGDKVYEVGTSEPGATVKLYAIRVADNVHASLGSETADSQGNWSHTITDMLLFQHTGDYRFTAVTVDAAGNSSKESEMDDYPVTYQSWPAPLDTPGYTLTTSGEVVDQAQIESLLSSTGNALLSSQIPTDGYSGKIYLPAPSSANAGNRVYINILAGVDVGLYQDTRLLKALSVGSETTWYSNGSEWKQIY